MNLYLLQWEGENWYVEAESFGDAIAIWRAQQTEEDQKDFIEDPESLALVDTGAVLRRK